MNQSKMDIMMVRLNQERKLWKKSAMPDFVAKPIVNQDGTMNMTQWKCEIPGPIGSVWEGGVY